MTRLSILVLLALATAAAAEPSYHPYAVSPGPAPEPAPFVDAGYVGGGAGLTVDHFFNAFFDLEGGLRLGSIPLWAWGSTAYGGSADVEGGGRFLQIRAGIESRACWSQAVCVFLGAFAGKQSQTWEKQDEMTEHHDGPIYGTRFGLDAGGERTRFRVGLEAYRYLRSSEVSDRTTAGGGVTLALIHRM